MSDTLPEKSEYPDRWTLIRDLAVFQVKLIVDGLRDFVLVPASLIAGIISLASGSKHRPGPHFYQLIGTGKQSEAWINLFGALDHAPAGIRNAQRFADTNLDELVGRLESYVVDEYRRGGITAQAKERIDEALGRIQRTQDDGE